MLNKIMLTARHYCSFFASAGMHLTQISNIIVCHIRPIFRYITQFNSILFNSIQFNVFQISEFTYRKPMMSNYMFFVCILCDVTARGVWQTPPHPKKVTPRNHTKFYGQRSFQYASPRLWNSLPNNLKDCATLEQFKSQLKTHLFNHRSA